MVGKIERIGEFFRVKIDLPSFQVELVSKDPTVTLPELRKILETVSVDDQLIYEEFITQELHAMFSKTFTANVKLMQVVKRILKQEEDYRTFKMAIPTTATLDLENDTHSVRVSRKEVKRQVNKLTETVPGTAVKQGIIHVAGNLSKEDKLLIVDHIHKFMPTAQLRAFESKGMTDTVTVECIFFGEFPEEEE